jgi:hypothetical protein
LEEKEAYFVVCPERSHRHLDLGGSALGLLLNPLLWPESVFQSAVAPRIELAGNPGFHDLIQRPRCEEASRFSEQSSRMAAPNKSPDKRPEMTREEDIPPRIAGNADEVQIDGTGMTDAVPTIHFRKLSPNAGASLLWTGFNYGSSGKGSRRG